MPYSNYSLRYLAYSSACGWCGSAYCNCEAIHGAPSRGGLCVHGEPASNCDRGGCDEW